MGDLQSNFRPGGSTVNRLQPPIPHQGFLTRLARDKSGNTLVMLTMAIIPLVAMSGSAVDIGRAYLVKTRLQQACDAGVLAGRRAMAGSTYGTAEQAQATAFFNTNMSQTFAGVTNVTFTTSGGANSEVSGSASARVPTTLMKLFYQEGIDVNVSCNARLDVSNTDVVMVLDVTGSMDDCPDDSSACNGSTTTNKISILRGAVVDFYDTVRAATGTNTRFRLGFVSYSQSVNLGAGTTLLPAGWTVANWTYQSRVANMNAPLVRSFTGQGTATTSPDTSSYPVLSSSACTTWGSASSANHISGLPRVVSGTAPSVVGRLHINNTAADWGWPGAPDTSGTTRSCRRRYQQQNYTGAVVAYGFNSWSYLPVTLNVANYQAGNTVNVYTGSAKPTGTVATSRAYDMVELVTAVSGPAVASTSTSFEGCYEERDTVAQSTFSSIPNGALDLRHDVVPGSDAERWRPIWSELVYDRGGPGQDLNTQTDRSPVGNVACPALSSKLADRTRAQVQTYVNSLQPTGFTFHDLGMAWGRRMVSPTGVWGAENLTAPNGNPISRHIIFMTDGDMRAYPWTLSSHGFENMDRRTFGTGGGTLDENASNSIHSSRFIAMCNAARADGITVWTVAFGTANPPTLVNCADPGRAFTATNATQLRAQFQAIASQIAQLRLSQ